MRELIENFPNQINEASVALKNLNPTKHDEYAQGFTPSGILVLGMGGSGIGGAFVSSILGQTSKVPIITNADYGIPGWVCSKTLVVACSNSGNTEETLAATSEAIKRGARVACIASGGKLEKLAEKEGLPLVKVPGGFPPRSQFATSLLSLSWTLSRFGVFHEKLYEELVGTAESTKENADNVVERASAIAELIDGKQIHIYSDTNMECVALRWRQQLNENSKLLVNSNVFPELNHNELVGWASGSGEDVVIILRTPEDSERTQVRMDLSAEIFQEMGADVIFVDPDGEDQMQRLMDLVFLGDFISLLLAEKSGVDPVEIENIDRLKNKLSEL